MLQSLPRRPLAGAARPDRRHLGGRRADARARRSQERRRGRGRHLRRRLLLVRGGGLREGAGRDPRRLGLHRRHGRQADLRAGLGQDHRPLRGGAGHLRSDQGQLSRSSSTGSGATSIPSMPGASSATRAAPTTRGSSSTTTRRRRSPRRPRQALEGRPLQGRRSPPRSCPRRPFWPAEDYHQDYYKKNANRYRLLQDRLRPRQRAWSRSGARPSRRRR